MIRHITTLTCLALMTFAANTLPINPPLPPTAEEAARTLLIASPEQAENWRGGTPDTSLKVEGCTQSIRWDHGKSDSLSLKTLPRDWTGPWNALDFWLHSNQALKSKFILLLHSQNASTEGMDYYYYNLTQTWKGWKHFTIPLKDLQPARMPTGWHNIHSFIFTASGWGNTPNPKTVIHAGPVRLIYLKPTTGPVTKDRQLLDAINLQAPGLEKVRAAYEANDIMQAKKELSAYFRHRTNVRHNVDPKDSLGTKFRNPNYDASKADKIARNTLSACGIEHVFGETIDWSINPTKLKYAEWTWQLSRHSFWFTLAQAYRATGNEKYATAFVRQLRSWIIQNPLPATSGNVVGSRWRTISTGIRMSSSWPNAYFTFLLSPSFDDDSHIMFLKSVYEHARHLLEYPTSNNWLATEMNGLYHVGVLFPEFKDAKLWRDTAAQCLFHELNNQVYPDGAQKELAPGYHGVSLTDFVETYEIAKLNGLTLPGDYIQRLEKMYAMYLNTVSPQGQMPAFNDSGWGNVLRYLKQGASYFPQRQDFLYVATNGKQGTEPSFTSLFMPYAGWYVMRSSWAPKAYYACFEVGPYGTGHQHEDKLSFVVCANGRRLLTEGGIYPYDRSQWRKYVLSARAHNVVRVDGLDQQRGGTTQFYTTPSALTNPWITNDTFDYAEGVYDEGFGPKRQLKVRHQRSILFLKETTKKLLPYWLVIDIMTPPDQKPHAYDAWFHFNSQQADLIPGLNAAVSTENKSHGLLIAPLNARQQTLRIVSGQEKPEVQGWVPAAGYDVRPVATPIFSQTASGQTVQPYLFIPIPTGKGHLVDRIVQEGDTHVVTFTDGRTDRIHIQTTPQGGLDKLTVVRLDAKKNILATIIVAP